MLQMPRGSFDQALIATLLLRAFEAAVCEPANASHASRQLRPGTQATVSLLLKAFEAAVCQAVNASNASRQLRPATQATLPLCCSGRSRLPFARPRMPQMPRGSFDQALTRQPSVTDCYGVHACDSRKARGVSFSFISCFYLPLCRERANVFSGIVFPTACHAWPQCTHITAMTKQPLSTPGNCARDAVFSCWLHRPWPISTVANPFLGPLQQFIPCQHTETCIDSSWLHWAHP